MNSETPVKYALLSACIVTSMYKSRIERERERGATYLPTYRESNNWCITSWDRLVHDEGFSMTFISSAST